MKGRLFQLPASKRRVNSRFPWDRRGLEVKNALPLLVQALDFNDRRIRRKALEILSRVKSQTWEAVVGIFQALKKKDLEVRQLAVQTFPARFG